MDDPRLAEANAVLAAHSLAAVRLARWTGADGLALFEIFHIEWEGTVFGELIFGGVRYVQMTDQTSWGYRMRLAPAAILPSRGDLDSSDIVYEFYTEDGTEPSAFVVAECLEVKARGTP